VKICAAAWLSLLKVNRYCCAISDDADKSSLLVPVPASNAGAYGGGHRNRLNVPGRMEYSATSPRLTESHLAPSHDTFAVSRRLASVWVVDLALASHLETAHVSRGAASRGPTNSVDNCGSVFWSTQDRAHVRTGSDSGRIRPSPAIQSSRGSSGRSDSGGCY
jgi:hypothetical protein